MNNSDFVAEYVNALKEQFRSGHAREHAYRPALERLMSSFEDVTAVNDPKRSEHGNPDMAFLKKSHTAIILGYAEAKDIDINLEKTLKSDQLRRYAGYANLFLTNYLDFRFLRNGEEYETIAIGHLKDGKITFDETQLDRLHRELKAFLEQPPESIRSGRRLAEIMGGKARRIRERLVFYLNHDEKQNSELEKIFKMMKELLVHDLTIEKFADMYAQTLVYGLFVARYNDKTPETFSRSEARDLVPASNPFLREFFDHIVGPRFDNRLANIVDELCAVFEVSDVHLIIQRHLRLFEVENDKDPIIHFYEDFLKEYDPDERKKMGAYYTPIPVVRFMIRQVDNILKRDFDLRDGIADSSKRTVEIEMGQDLRHDRRFKLNTKQKVDVHRVQILDPAVGTATFLNETVTFIHNKFNGQEGRWASYVNDGLLDRLHGFELMMAPYTIAHLKLGMTLQDTGAGNLEKRLGVYLTNTLEEGQKEQIDLFMHFGLAEAVSAEANEAAKIKHERPIMVIIGNPPYSGESSNKTEYAASLVAKYKHEPGGLAKLRERNPKWINDDYVKFIAFAEDMIDKNQEGIVAMITNHGYLDNPTFRGMRWHLANTFDSIYVLDLHGNTKKKEVAPDGSKDENVFDIQQGVAIILAVKTGRKQKGQLAEVHSADLYGTRSHKFDRLGRDEVSWSKLPLDMPMLYFAKKNSEGQADYEKGFRVSDLFITSSVGIVTSADKLLIGDSRDRVLDNIEGAMSTDGSGKIYARLRGHTIDPDLVLPVSYRPFDDQFIYYAPDILERSRDKVMRNFLRGDNVGLMVCRQQKTTGFAHALVHTELVESSYVSNNTSEIGTTFPLYLYHDDGTRTVNLKPDTLKHFTQNLEQAFAPEDVLDYIYAILYSPEYRDAYREFLKTDFPRIPAPIDDQHFRRLVGLGKQLRELHLMTAAVTADLITIFPVTGSELVEKAQYTDGKVWINETQYFGNVPEVAWNFRIGAYQPAQKYLKDRRGHKLSSSEIEHYQKIIKVLVETEKLMTQIDATS